MKKWLIILLFPLIAQGQSLPFRHTLLFTQPIDSGNISYGYHGLWNFAGRPLTNAEVLDSLNTLANFQLYRWPGGTLSNTFQWQTGTDSLTATPEVNTLLDLKALYDKRAGATDIVYCLNICTRPLSDQLNMLHYADSIGLPVHYLEAGNEINIPTSLAHTIFTTAKQYADTCAVWMAAIKAVYPDVLFGVVGENKYWSKKWNDTMLSINPDALITHLGPNPVDFVTDSVADLSKLETALMDQWNVSGMGNVTTVPTWVTEFNYNFDDDIQMNEQNRIITTLYLLRRVTELISQTNQGGTKLMCVRGIEGQKEGAFEVGNTFITRMATAFAMTLFIP